MGGGFEESSNPTCQLGGTKTGQAVLTQNFEPLMVKGSVTFFLKSDFISPALLCGLANSALIQAASTLPSNTLLNMSGPYTERANSLLKASLLSLFKKPTPFQIHLAHIEYPSPFQLSDSLLQKSWNDSLQKIQEIGMLTQNEIKYQYTHAIQLLGQTKSQADSIINAARADSALLERLHKLSPSELSLYRQSIYQNSLRSVLPKIKQIQISSSAPTLNGIKP